MLFQVLILKYFVLFGVGFCFLYLMFLLFLPLEIGFASAMVIGLIAGLIVDLFYNTLFIHSLTVFLIESGGNQLMGLSILKSIVTTLISLVFMIAIQYLFYSKAKR